MAPPELCTIPDRGSSLDTVVSAAASATLELSTDVGGFELSVDVDSVSAADALDDDESEADDDSADGSATATHGVVATAVPMPSATANAPTRPMYFAELMITLSSLGPLSFRRRRGKYTGAGSLPIPTTQPSCARQPDGFSHRTARLGRCRGVCGVCRKLSPLPHAGWGDRQPQFRRGATPPARAAAPPPKPSARNHIACRTRTIERGESPTG